ncbi:hypothetical protein [Streptomyces sp. ADI93-02]|uniref:hypothetical protein n=1 Tax=Streptomyces sp. ADI93-02 TaxID=1522757 RepID=UPI000F55927F|nr:hypothetical protein [Streptomyces sp. ADI93-02]RPK33137.1 hypothetical protein EES40_35980 [Streptomyces sp. ADI93-02]
MNDQEQSQARAVARYLGRWVLGAVSIGALAYAVLAVALAGGRGAFLPVAMILLTSIVSGAMWFWLKLLDR